MYCKNCGALNDEDSMFCKHCGFPISEQDLDYKDLKELQKKQEENEKTKGNKDKNKSKNKTKTKTKNKIKNKTKNKVKKEKPRKNNSQKSEKGMTFGQKILMFILFVMVFSLIGVLALGGYHYYKSRNIEVPNLIGMTYEEAELILAKKDLKIQKVEQITEDETENNIVLKQNQTPGKKVRKNKTIKVIVGKYQKTYILENLTGMNIDNAISILESNNIKYEIKYKETEDYENSTIISQSPDYGKKLTEEDKVTLTVAKNTNQNKETEENTKIEQSNEEETNNSETNEQDQNQNIE
ncbi:MAG: PASTA domain-containing protein [Bacilli bacterium]